MTPARAVAAIAILACSVVGRPGEEPVGEFCTLIGCYSGVEARLVPPPAGPFRVADFTPDYVSVRVSTPSDTVVLENVRLEYQESRPNGPACPPVCRIARVDVALPADRGTQR